MNVNNVSRDDWIFGGVGLLLLIDLLFLPWFSITVFGHSFSSAATDNPDGWAAVIAVLAIIAAVADLAIERLAPQFTIPAFGGGRVQTRGLLAVAAAIFVALKFLFQIHFSLFGFGFYAGVVLTAGFAYLGFKPARSLI